MKSAVIVFAAVRWAETSDSDAKAGVAHSAIAANGSIKARMGTLSDEKQGDGASHP